MHLDQRLVDAALAQLDRRWPADEPGGAAALRLEVAVPDAASAMGWRARTLRDINPYYRGSQFTDDGTWPSQESHSE